MCDTNSKQKVLGGRRVGFVLLILPRLAKQGGIVD